MNIKVMTDRLRQTAGELRESERKLRMEADNIGEITAALRRAGDESMTLIASNLTATLEALNNRIRILTVMSVALEKIADMYTMTERRVAGHGDKPVRAAKPRYGPRDTGRTRSRTKAIFEEL